MNTMIWLSEAMNGVNEGSRAARQEQEDVKVSGNSTVLTRARRAKSVFYAVIVSIVLVGFTLTTSVDEVAAASLQPRKIVAAGLGYQDADSSSITVKTYDAVTGEVLSAENYELDIKDDAPSTIQPRTRIFAGGVGIGADGLSEFTIRVYDAATGRFLWEGRLNLGVGSDPSVEAYPVVAQVQPRAALQRISSRAKSSGQPYFVLRAMDPETGQLVWADQFSADPANVRVERISRSVVGMTGVFPREIDFRIKMPDEAGRQLLWEDQVVPDADAEFAKPERSDDNAGILPAVPHGTDQYHKRDDV